MKYWTGSRRMFWRVRELYCWFPRLTLWLYGKYIADTEASRGVSPGGAQK